MILKCFLLFTIGSHPDTPKDKELEHQVDQVQSASHVRYPRPECRNGFGYIQRNLIPGESSSCLLGEPKEFLLKQAI
jgi:hypothetical protein